VQAAIAELGQTPPFLLSGRDVLKRGVAAGPDVGRVLDQARRDWIEAGCPGERTQQFAFVESAIAQRER